jgi:hypothetical protein
VRLTQLLSLVLTDSASERVRKSHERAIKELQAEVRALRSASTASGLWAPVGEPVKVSATVTSFAAVSGQSLDADGEWLLQLRLLLATGTTHRIRIGPGGTFADTGDHESDVYQGGASVTVDSGELWLTGGISAQGHLRADIYMSKLPGGLTAYNFSGSVTASAPGSVRHETGSGVDAETADLTRIDVGSTVANRILAGSTAQLYRRVA